MDNAIEGQGNLVITGVQEEEGGGGVAPVHLNGVGIRTDDGHVMLDNEVYSQCLSQMSQTQRIIDRNPSPGDALSLAPEPSPSPGDDLPSASGGRPIGGFLLRKV